MALVLFSKDRICIRYVLFQQWNSESSDHIKTGQRQMFGNRGVQHGPKGFNRLHPQDVNSLG